jgi:TPP-dependent pyruvate/acetoin dehydrogenase alpha subunit
VGLDSFKKLYEQMLVIRLAEQGLQKLFSDGLIPGFLHLSIGQEAVPVGVSSCLRDTDTVSSNHRGHGHTLAKGVDLEGFFAEVLGRATGLCRGRGGSMHVADLSIGMLGANGIVGAGLPITTGSALALKLKGEGDIAVVYFGDGAMAEGLVHECLNIAALWKLPVLFVCENNGWSEFSPTSRQMATSLDKLAIAFSIEYASADGNKVKEVAKTCERLVNEMRKIPRPMILECSTTRVRGHFEGDKQDYREAAELESLAERDPLLQAKKEMLETGVPDAWFSLIEETVAARVAKARESALAAPLPDAGNITSDVYTVTEN